MKAVPSLIKQHKPKNEEIRYHYCSADSFMAITKNKTLRFCDLRHMNDITELSHGEKLLDEMLDNIVLSIELRIVIRTVLDFFRNRTLLLLTECLTLCEYVSLGMNIQNSTQFRR